MAPRDVDSGLPAHNEAYVKARGDSAHSAMMAEVWRDLKFQVANGAADMATFAATTMLTRRMGWAVGVGTGMWTGGLMKPAIMTALDYEDSDFRRDSFTGAAAGIMGPAGRGLGAWASRQIEDLPLARLGTTFASRAPGGLAGLMEGTAVGYTTGFNSTYALERFHGTDNEVARSHAIETGVDGLPKFMAFGTAAGAAMKGSVFNFGRVVRGR
jgi:hypothetical protein